MSVDHSPPSARSPAPLDSSRAGPSAQRHEGRCDRARVPLFAGLSKRELGQVASIADEIDLPAEKLLIREGEHGREFFVLLEGEAEVARKGKKLATRRAGEFFGEIALVSNLPRTATVKTRNPVRALVIRDVEFRALLRKKPSIAVKVLQAVAERLPSDVV